MTLRHQVSVKRPILLHKDLISRKKVIRRLLVHVLGIEVVLLHQAHALEKEVALLNQVHALEAEVVLFRQVHALEKEGALHLQDHVLEKEGAPRLQVHVLVSEVHQVKVVHLLEHEVVLIRQDLVLENVAAFSHLGHQDLEVAMVLLQDHGSEVARRAHGVLALAEWTRRFMPALKRP